MKQRLKKFLAFIGLSSLTDAMAYHAQKIRYAASNRRFKKENPGLAYPPDYFLYETYRLNYKAYFENISIVSGEILNTVKQYTDVTRVNFRILDWGCGLAGNIKGIKASLKETAELYGCDINTQMIEWDKNNIPGINFSMVNISPPTNFESNFFDFIYGISVFTHLSEEKHKEWMEELSRILKPGGILLFTTHGERFKKLLSPGEKKQFDKGELVTRKYKKEGHRIFTAFHPPSYIEHLATTKFRVLKFYDGNTYPELIGDQDKWIMQKI